ncbi:ATP-dependent DNA helicase RepA [Buchnera aphidicola (Nipponaphis monzeni)]|uniref:DNA 3'-5' helicase n=1 Tax=Buchnera aphidicola (Nipponaphis monzeni) TaxID=2495405 RepID=A0A455TAS8_9GAMM|nr:UvrD-helicase domain-containing protein [Buchnera aphidicola]BBI01443.1 ATP-dependent DNA helicase RepA [Buchnera aphidicola (Nipponaphis monzeni)]
MYLNITQKKIIKYSHGPCLVLAGAGSGKTRVVISKIIYLINVCKVKSENIVAITFTNKSAQEMQLQLIKHFKNCNNKIKVNISTFHSFGLRIIKSELFHLNLKANFSLLNQEDKLFLLKTFTKSVFKKNNDLLLKLSSKISYWKNKLIDPLNAKLKSITNLDKTFAMYYDLYQFHLNNFNKLDLDDLIFIPTLLLKNNASARLRWQKKVDYLLVDEYQDTNVIQYNLIKMLNPKNFTLVGDDDQSIYSWRGAEPKNLLFLKIDYPHLKIFKLEQNYRSSGRILKASNKLIANNLHIYKKSLITQLKYGSKIKILQNINEEYEAKNIAKEIVSHYKKFNTQFSDYAVLYRSNQQSKILESIFIKNHIPYNINNRTQFLKFFEIKILMNYLKFILNPNDNFYFLKVINVPGRKIGISTIKKLKSWAIKNNISLYKTCYNDNLEKILSKNKVKSLKKFIKWIKESIVLSDVQPMQIISHIIKNINYKNWLKESSKDLVEFKKNVKNISIFVNLINELLIGNSQHPQMTLSEIVSYLTLYEDVNVNRRSHLKGVFLMTLHASKGLEFPFVFIAGLEEGILPHYSSISQNNIEEERRLMYVGMTRAKKELTLTFANKRSNYGLTTLSKYSRFLLELPQEDLVWINQKNNFNSNILLNNSINRIKFLKKMLKLSK